MQYHVYLEKNHQLFKNILKLVPKLTWSFLETSTCHSDAQRWQ